MAIYNITEAIKIIMQAVNAWLPHLSAYFTSPALYALSDITENEMKQSNIYMYIYINYIFSQHFAC